MSKVHYRMAPDIHTKQAVHLLESLHDIRAGQWDGGATDHPRDHLGPGQVPVPAHHVDLAHTQ